MASTACRPNMSTSSGAAHEPRRRGPVRRRSASGSETAAASIQPLRPRSRSTARDAVRRSPEPPSPSEAGRPARSPQLLLIRRRWDRGRCKGGAVPRSRRRRRRRSVLLPCHRSISLPASWRTQPRLRSRLRARGPKPSCRPEAEATCVARRWRAPLPRWRLARRATDPSPSGCPVSTIEVQASAAPDSRRRCRLAARNPQRRLDARWRTGVQSRHWKPRASHGRAA